MNISTISKSYKLKSLSFTSEKLSFLLVDGRELSVPLEWFPKLKTAKKKQLNNWRLIGDGEGIHWPEIDEDILIEKLFD